MDRLIPGVGHIKNLIHSTKGRSIKTKTPAAAPASTTRITGILRTRLPVVTIGTPATIQATAKNGKLQNRNIKEICRSQKQKPTETPPTKYVAAKAASEI
jgi:hypothetical protein